MHKLLVFPTGHRPNRFQNGYSTEFETKLQELALERIMHMVDECQCVLSQVLGITGMALGWDQAVTTEYVKMGISFEAFVPFPEQANAWPASSRKRYHQLLVNAAKEHTVCPFYDSTAFKKRNRAMIDRAVEFLELDPQNRCLFLSLWDGLPTSGTGECVETFREVLKTKPQIKQQIVHRNVFAQVKEFYRKNWRRS